MGPQGESERRIGAQLHGVAQEADMLRVGYPPLRIRKVQAFKS